MSDYLDERRDPLWIVIDALKTVIRLRIRAGHNDFCGAVVSDGVTYPCSCGHDELVNAICGDE